MKRSKDKLLHFLLATAMMLLMGSQSALAQRATVSGNVSDQTGEPLIGATVSLKGDAKVATITDFDGNFSLNVPNARSAVLVISYVGMVTQEVVVGGKSSVKVVMQDDSNMLEETVIVGYGQQKKASVVGAITQTTGEVLERAAGITDIGAALTGNLPGVVTMASSGMPGE